MCIDDSPQPLHLPRVIPFITHKHDVTQAVLQRESLKSDLDSKLTVIFQNYGMELEQVGGYNNNGTPRHARQRAWFLLRLCRR